MSKFDDDPFADPKDLYRQREERRKNEENEKLEAKNREMEMKRIEEETRAKEESKLSFQSNNQNYGLSGNMDQQSNNPYNMAAPNYEQTNVDIPATTELSQTDKDRVPNFPPIPTCGVIRPIFYQNISIDIPVAYQFIVLLAFRVWMAYSILLTTSILWNVISFGASLGSDAGISTNNAGSGFGLSILWFLLFIPLTYIFWFRTLYRAFRKDSSLMFFSFFIIAACFFIVLVVIMFGVEGSGYSGVIYGVTLASRKLGSLKFSGTMMIISGVLFGILNIANVYILMKVHFFYRHSEASFQKAQGEFFTNVMSNPAARQAATNAAVSGVNSQFNGRN
ncbi:Secretory carrier membrane protein 4 [Intoshia linei]|uniref:Secretory carrier-associated membrane protein n=1 Tax=Intoshia linei TaxID=1819745 RepID=A0A177B1N4_9BILA|nr:Secretory carrier membrane protein 4 [Intoshia linei]